MKIDPISHKIDPESLENKEQAEVMVIFLRSEVYRHMDDINETQVLIKQIIDRWVIE